jgi:hydrogenase-4 component B
MIKTAVYGFLRVVLDFLGPQSLQIGTSTVSGAIPLWWGVTLLILGTVSAVLGVMYALMEQDIKRLLAFSSVENMGLIFIGIGVALMFLAYGQQGLAAIALFAALYHLLNHAVFKSLLFMGAGSILYATHTRNMEKLGGLIRRMPQTAFYFLIGSLAVSSLPPFNGFIGEWLLIQSLLLLSIKLPHSMLSILGPLVGTAVVLTGALVAGGFVKAFGITFLARPRSEQPAHAKEVPLTMRVAMGIMALLCLVLGVTPGLVAQLLKGAVTQLSGAVLTAGNVLNSSSGSALIGSSLNSNSLEGWLILTPVRDGLATLSLLSVLAAMVIIIPGVWLTLRLLAGKTSTRVDETWGCGITLEPRMEYTGTSFSKPVRVIFKKLLTFDRQVKTTFNTWSYFPKKIIYRSEQQPFFESRLYEPLSKLTLITANLIRRVQTGSIHLYLAYILVTLVVLLSFAR